MQNNTQTSSCHPKGYTRVPNAAMDRLGTLKCIALKVYLRLCRAADNRTGQCDVIRFTLAKQLGITTRAVGDALKQLRDAGLIQARRHQHGCRYRICGWPKGKSEKGTGVPISTPEGNGGSYQNIPEGNGDDIQIGTAVPIVQDLSSRLREEGVTRVTKPPKKGKGKFTPPTVDEVRAYCQERRNNIDPEYFVAYYTRQGWTLKNGRPMSCWRSAVVTFEKNNKQSPESIYKDLR